MWKDLKYLIAYIAPISAILGFKYGGIGYYAAFFVGFVFIPTVELLFPGSDSNFSTEMETEQDSSRLFDFYLYFNLPLVYWILYIFLQTIEVKELTTTNYIGLYLSMAVIIGTCGINVAHELGHRNTWFDKLCARLLLIPALYTHFTNQHNSGHHKNVATELDPATAKYGEMVYTFWIKSIINNYFEAWKLEARKLASQNHHWFHYKNEMIWLQIIQIAYLYIIKLNFGLYPMIGAIVAAFGGILLLETVNYIEHYGLRRKKLSSGRYEPVSFVHSWNSNHELGRIFLYELTRHSDHHFKSTRKYQILKHYDESPQLPYGYPMSILISLVPPLWFKIMNKRIKVLQSA